MAEQRANNDEPQPGVLFTAGLATVDPDISQAVDAEQRRQREQIELIASENIASKAVLEAQGSVLTNKYAEGYPGRRYYGGCEHVDVVESLAIKRAQALFDCSFANVQPHSGAQANQGVFLALLRPGDTFLGMSLAAGGHLTHGAKPNLSGKWFNTVQYGVVEETGLIDYDEVERLAQEHKPKLIVAGGSAYPRIIDFAAMRSIADSVGALLMVDMAHFAGLVAGRVHPNPLEHADVVTTTTHKTLRGPRGGMILSRDDALGKKINSAIFPGLQGGPLEHVIAGKAVAFKLALEPEFQTYSAQVVANAKALGEALMSNRIKLVTGGTDTHLLNVDLRPLAVTGKVAEHALESVGLTCNKNAIPYDPQPPAITSGVRLGSPAATSRGFGVAEFKTVGEMIGLTLSNLNDDGIPDEAIAKQVRATVRELCERHPIY